MAYNFSMNNGKFICNQFMNISQSEYKWLAIREVLIGKSLPYNIYTPANIIYLSKNHIITNADIANAEKDNMLINLILAVKELDYPQ